MKIRFQMKYQGDLSSLTCVAFYVDYIYLIFYFDVTLKVVVFQFLNYFLCMIVLHLA